MKQTRIRFGRRSIAAIIEFMAGQYTWAQLRQLFFKHGLDGRFEGQNKLSAVGSVLRPVAGERPDPRDLAKVLEMLEEIVRGLVDDGRSHARHQYGELQAAFRVDEFDLVEGRISGFLSASVSPAAEQGLLDIRLDLRGFTEAKRHLDQVIDNAAKGNWEAANGQIRSFMEGLSAMPLPIESSMATYLRQLVARRAST